MSRNTISELITVSIAVIACTTLAHVGFAYSVYFKPSPILMRPEMRTYAHFERIISFIFVGMLFSFAYPRRVILVCCIVSVGATLLEILQTSASTVTSKWKSYRTRNFPSFAEIFRSGAAGLIQSLIENIPCTISELFDVEMSAGN